MNYWVFPSKNKADTRLKKKQYCEEYIYQEDLPGGWVCYNTPSGESCSYTPPTYTWSCGSGSDGGTWGWPDDGNGGVGGGSCPPPYNCGNTPPPNQFCPNEILTSEGYCIEGAPLQAPSGVPQEVYDSLNQVEKELCWSSPVNCLKVYQAKVTAENWSASVQPRTGESYAGWNDPQDALRHTRWNAEMAKNIGVSQAKIWADAHEQVDANDLNNPYATDPFEYVMDIWNNQKGRTIGSNFPNNIAQKIIDAMNNGDLWLWRCINTSSRFGCGETPLD